MQERIELRLLLAFLILGCVFVAIRSDCFAQSCIETDTVDGSSGKNFNIRGTTKAIDGSGKVQSFTDACDSNGVTLTEFYCSGVGAVSEITSCVYGCLDGACVLPGINQQGCFTEFIIKAIIAPGTSSATLMLDSVQQSIASLWLSVAKSSDERSDEDLEVQLKNSAGTVLSTVYADFNPAFFDIKGSDNSVVGVARVVIPFYPLAKTAVFRGFGTSVSYSFPLSLQKCVRPCIAAGNPQGGKEGIDTCCAGSIKEKYNDRNFTCLPNPSPSPSGTLQ